MRTPLGDDSMRKCLTRSVLLSSVLMTGQMLGKTRYTSSQWSLYTIYHINIYINILKRQSLLFQMDHG